MSLGKSWLLTGFMTVKSVWCYSELWWCSFGRWNRNLQGHHKALFNSVTCSTLFSLISVYFTRIAHCDSHLVWPVHKFGLVVFTSGWRDVSYHVDGVFRIWQQPFAFGIRQKHPGTFHVLGMHHRPSAPNKDDAKCPNQMVLNENFHFMLEFRPAFSCFCNAGSSLEFYRWSCSLPHFFNCWYVDFMRHGVTKVETSNVKFSTDAQCFNVHCKMETPWTLDTRKMPPPPQKKKQREVLDGFQGCEEDDPDDGGKVWILSFFVSRFRILQNTSKHQGSLRRKCVKLWLVRFTKKTPNWVGKI